MRFDEMCRARCVLAMRAVPMCQKKKKWIERKQAGESVFRNRNEEQRERGRGVVRGQKEKMTAWGAGEPSGEIENADRKEEATTKQEVNEPARIAVVIFILVSS